MSKFTKQAIIDTFIKMLEVKSLDKITVKELVKECGINRNTFYYYYKDIYDLLEDIFIQESSRIISENRDDKSFYEEYMRELNVMMEYKNALMHVYNSKSREIIENYLLSVMPQFIRHYVVEKIRQNNYTEVREEDISFICDFYKYAVSGCTIEWIRGGMQQNQEEFVRKMSYIFDGTISAAVESCLCDNHT